jgi:hypothetical protein
MRQRFSLLLLALLLAACGPVTTGVVSPNPRPTLEAATGIVVITAQVSTVEPITGLTPQPNFTLPPAPTATSIPPLPSGLSPTELKYRVLDQYLDFFFCDPDLYPIARDDELNLAKARFPQIQADAELYNAILTHNQLGGLTAYTGEQLLAIYRDYKRLNAVIFQKAGNVYQFNIQIGPEGQGYAIVGVIDGAGAIAERQRTSAFTTCPICLAKGTLIDTPRGPVAVEAMRAGMPVWTAAVDGERVEGVVLNVANAFAPPGHRVVHLKLADGRELLASPGHPTIDGRTLADLLPGDLLDGSRLTHIEQTLYGDAATYDLLPSGPTGFYWANGILIASMLAGK